MIVSYLTFMAVRLLTYIVVSYLTNMVVSYLTNMVVSYYSNNYVSFVIKIIGFWSKQLSKQRITLKKIKFAVAKCNLKNKIKISYT